MSPEGNARLVEILNTRGPYMTYAAAWQMFEMMFPGGAASTFRQIQNGETRNKFNYWLSRIAPVLLDILN